MYREQVIQLEDTLARIREEGEVGKDLFKVRGNRRSARICSRYGGGGGLQGSLQGTGEWEVCKDLFKVRGKGGVGKDLF